MKSEAGFQNARETRRVDRDGAEQSSSSKRLTKILKKTRDREKKERSWPLEKLIQALGRPSCLTIALDRASPRPGTKNV